VTDPASPPKHRRGMLGFYLAMGALLALAVGFGFAWTPLRVSYWEREVRSDGSLNCTDYSSGYVPGQRDKAARKLAECGPVSLQAFRRLLSKGDPAFRVAVLYGLTEDAKATWAVRLLVDASGDPDFCVAGQAIMAVSAITGKRFLPPYKAGLASEPRTTAGAVGIGRRNLQAWWEKEGRAKYGGGDG
jgi:hypothetical protein